MVVLAHLQKRKKLELKRINSVKKRRQNRSLEVTGLYAAQRPDAGWRVQSCVLVKVQASVFDQTLGEEVTGRTVAASGQGDVR